MGGGGYKQKNPKNFKAIAHIEKTCFWKNIEGIENVKNSTKRD